MKKLNRLDLLLNILEDCEITLYSKTHINLLMFKAELEYKINMYDIKLIEYKHNSDLIQISKNYNKKIYYRTKLSKLQKLLDENIV